MSAVAGWYGKIPATGDFVVRRLPPAFRDAWDRWLQETMAGARERLGGDWRDAYLSMPAWRFLHSPGMVTDDTWAGLMVPSVDAVGRQFPLTFACALPGAGLDLAASLEQTAGWYDAMEEIALEALEPRADVASIDRAVAARPFPLDALARRDGGPDATVPFRSASAQMLAVPAAALRPAAAQLAEPCGLWLSSESESFPRAALLCERLPSAKHFCGMMDGRWREHGWANRDLQGRAA